MAYSEAASVVRSRKTRASSNPSAYETDANEVDGRPSLRKCSASRKYRSIASATRLMLTTVTFVSTVLTFVFSKALVSAVMYFRALNSVSSSSSFNSLNQLNL